MADSSKPTEGGSVSGSEVSKSSSDKHEKDKEEKKKDDGPGSDSKSGNSPTSPEATAPETPATTNVEGDHKAIDLSEVRLSMDVEEQQVADTPRVNTTATTIDIDA